MRGKQTSNILYKDNEHMDAFYLNNGNISDNDHYIGAGRPAFATAIAACFDDKKYPWNGDENHRINKLDNVWRKIFDDSWMPDGSHYCFGWMYYRRYAEQGWYHPFFSFLDYKNFCVNYFFINMNTVYHYCNGNKVALLKRESYSYGTPNRLDTGYRDIVNGKVYDYTDNPSRIVYVSQNGIDWYPVRVPSKYKNGSFGHDSDFIYAVQNGFYMGTDESPACMVYIPYTLSDEDSSISFGEPRYLDVFKKKNVGFSGGVFDVGTDDIFSIANVWEDGRYYIKLCHLKPNNEFSSKAVLPSAGHFINVSSPLGKRRGKTYFYTTRGIGTNWGRMNYYSPEYENIEYRIASVDKDGNVVIEYKEVGTVVQLENGYLQIRKSRIGSLFDNTYNVLYDEEHDYFYIYSRIPYDDVNFPKTSPDGTNYNRIIIAKTRDFKHFEYHEAPPYRLMKGQLGKNSSAVCFDSQYQETLQAQYVMSTNDPITSMYTYRGQDRGSNNDCWCFNNGKVCPPPGIIFHGSIKDYNKNQTYSGYFWYFKDFLLRENEKDYLYSLREYKSDGTVRYENDSQTILDQLYGLDYPGKDTE